MHCKVDSTVGGGQGTYRERAQARSDLSATHFKGFFSSLACDRCSTSPRPVLFLTGSSSFEQVPRATKRPLDNVPRSYQLTTLARCPNE